ncbi:MAG: hypothetical protein J0L83_14535 [Chitinophagales bacterium]|nr:hypothetical protein [Chitinophagales bacterium]
MKTLITITAILLAVVVAAQKKTFVVGGFGGANTSKAWLQAEVAAGFWKPKFGGLMLAGKLSHEDANSLPITKYRLLISYQASIPMGRKLLSPYLSVGRNYAEAGCNFYLPVNYNTKMGLRAGFTTNGFILGASFLGIQNPFTSKKQHHAKTK